MEFDLQSVAPDKRYALLTGLVVPRPIAFISSLSLDGVRNAAPFSFFNLLCANPAIVALGINPRNGQPKDSFRNIVDTGEFVINVVTAELSARANACSADFLPEVDEFAAIGLTAAPSMLVRPPRIAEAPASLECRLVKTVPIDDRCTVLLGEVVYVHVEDALLNGFKVNQEKLDALGRMGGIEYTHTRDRISMARPAVPDAAGKKPTL